MLKIKPVAAVLLVAAMLTVFVGCEKRDNVLRGGERGNALFSFAPSGEDGQGKYVLNTASGRIHLPSCLYAEKISKENRLPTEDLAQAILEGYAACSHCLSNKTETENEENRNANSKD